MQYHHIVKQKAQGHETFPSSLKSNPPSNLFNLATIIIIKVRIR